MLRQLARWRSNQSLANSQSAIGPKCGRWMVVTGGGWVGCALTAMCIDSSRPITSLVAFLASVMRGDHPYLEESQLWSPINTTGCGFDSNPGKYLWELQIIVPDLGVCLCEIKMVLYHKIFLSQIYAAFFKRQKQWRQSANRKPRDYYNWACWTMPGFSYLPSLLKNHSTIKCYFKLTYQIKTKPSLKRHTMLYLDNFVSILCTTSSFFDIYPILWHEQKLLFFLSISLRK